MSLTSVVPAAVPVVASWREPATVAVRGTVIVIPGRGEHAGVYERFGRRISADGYRVWAVADPALDADRAEGQVRALLAAEPGPVVLVGSDTGALFAAGLVAGGLGGVDALVLAGLPTGSGAIPAAWDDELAARTACPTHQARLGDDLAVRRGALADRVPAAWVAAADAARIAVPVLGLHGDADTVSPLAGARSWYAGLARGELVTVAGGLHDALNDATHRTTAASIVLFLERLRLGADVPAIAHVEIVGNTLGETR
ncbi:MAG: lysophospholipase [Pseudonocardia sp. SCN 72-86]|nr:MAG: lysophospholipase [Pseudonocardia sp. SCN 72-86]